MPGKDRNSSVTTRRRLRACRISGHNVTMDTSRKWRARLPGAIAAAGTAAALSGCGLLPWPGGEGTTSLEPRDPRPPDTLVESPSAVAQAAVTAWGRDDAARLDLISTNGVERLLHRRFPEPAPSFINCSPDVVVAGAVSCLFWTEAHMIVLVSVPSDAGGWRVVSVRFRPTGRAI